MPETTWNPWKIATIGMALVIATALVTGLVVANWPSNHTAQPVAATSRAPVRHVVVTPSESADVVVTRSAPANIGPCDRSTETLKDALIGGAVGAGVGAAGGAIAGHGGKDAGKGAGIGALVGAAAGTAYGLNRC